MYIARKLDVASVLNKKPCFLFGSRQCGKSSLVRKTLPDAYMLDLLSGDTFTRLARNPYHIEEICCDQRPVVIDEIQKLPSLLDEVRRLIETKGMRFLLVGSSARKLRKGGVNLRHSRKTVETAKFHLFDTGVTRRLQGRKALTKGTPEYGHAFESGLCTNFHHMPIHFAEMRKFPIGGYAPTLKLISSSMVKLQQNLKPLAM